MNDIDRLPRTTKPLQEIPFVYGSYRELVMSLGEIDGLAATLTIATLYFVDSSRERENEQALGLEFAKRNQISTRFIELNKLPTHLVRLLLIATSKYLENFLDRFRCEQYALGRIWRDREHNEPDLKYTLACLPEGFDLSRKRIGRERYDLLEYYRLLRNASVHSGIDLKRLGTEYEKVSDYRSIVLNEYGLDAPNPFAMVTFHDHLLFTRVVKYVATDLCRLAPPRTADELKHVLADREFFPAAPATTLFSRLGDTAILTRKLRIFFRRHYHFDLSKDSSIEADLVQWLNGFPRKKERRRSGRIRLSSALKDSIAKGHGSTSGQA